MLHFRDYAQLCSLGALCYKYYSFPGASKIHPLYLCYFKQFQLIASCSSIKVISWLVIAASVFSCLPLLHLLKSEMMHVPDRCKHQWGRIKQLLQCMIFLFVCFFNSLLWYETWPDCNYCTCRCTIYSDLCLSLWSSPCTQHCLCTRGALCHIKIDPDKRNISWLCTECSLTWWWHRLSNWCVNLPATNEKLIPYAVFVHIQCINPLYYPD